MRGWGGIERLGRLETGEIGYRNNEGNKKRHGIVIVTSHVLDFVGKIADENIFIKAGKVCCVVDRHNDLEKIYERIYLQE